MWLLLSSLFRRGLGGPQTPPPAKSAQGVNKGPRVPAEAIQYVEEEIKKLRVPRLRLYEVRGRYCYIRHRGEPLCRFGYRGELDIWNFSIYKYSTGGYSNSEAFFPQRGKISDCLKTALHAYNII